MTIIMNIYDMFVFGLVSIESNIHVYLNVYVYNILYYICAICVLHVRMYTVKLIITIGYFGNKVNYFIR